MGLFAFKRLRERLEAASQEAASFAVQQSQEPQPVKPKRRPRTGNLINKPEGDGS